LDHAHRHEEQDYQQAPHHAKPRAFLFGIPIKIAALVETLIHHLADLRYHGVISRFEIIEVNRVPIGKELVEKQRLVGFPIIRLFNFFERKIIPGKRPVSRLGVDGQKALHRKVDDGGGDIPGVNPFIDQGSDFQGSETIGGFVLHHDAAPAGQIASAAVPEPEAEDQYQRKKAIDEIISQPLADSDQNPRPFNRIAGQGKAESKTFVRPQLTQLVSVGTVSQAGGVVVASPGTPGAGPPVMDDFIILQLQGQ